MEKPVFRGNSLSLSGVIFGLNASPEYKDVMISEGLHSGLPLRWNRLAAPGSSSRPVFLTQLCPDTLSIRKQSYKSYVSKEPLIANSCSTWPVSRIAHAGHFLVNTLYSWSSET